MKVEPWVELELIAVTPGMLPKARSSGVATVDAILSGLAPGKLACTKIVGMSTSGSGATGSLKNAITPATTRDGPALAVTLQRKGTTSLYGNLELRTAKEVVGVARGIAVYPEADERQALVPLLRPLKRGEVVTATYSADDGKKPVEIASGSYTAP